MNDPYVYPGTGVLINKLGVRSQSELDRAESFLAGARGLEVMLKPVKPTFDLAHLQELHRRVFQDVYSWAGELRKTPVTIDGRPFALPAVIEQAAGDVFERLRDERFLRRMPLGQFVDRSAEYFSELSTLHPFREGNGRVQRSFFGDLARHAGFEIDWRKISREDLHRTEQQSFWIGSGPLKKALAPITREVKREGFGFGFS